MNVIRNAIRFPVTTTVGVMFVVLFGVLALTRIPIQLTPDVEEPVVTVSTFWPGASPQEVERDIVDEQEEQLKSLEGLVKMESSSSDSQGEITLTFQVGTDKDASVLKVSNALEQVPSYPPDADKPVIRTVSPFANAIAWFVLQKVENEDGEFTATADEMAGYYDFADDVLKPAFERVPGVGASNVFGGTTREMHVLVDPARLAARQVTMNQLAAALERENRNYSGGNFDEGKRRYVVRTVGEYESPEDVEAIVIAVRNGVPVYLRDVGRAELAYAKPFARVYQLGQPVLAMNTIKEPGSNVLDVMEGLKGALAVLNTEELAPKGLRLEQVYDETEYILSSISLVRQSLLVGGILAIFILLLYLRSFTSTLVIAVAIPVSIVGTFLLMWWFGRTLNVVSLAGMAFAVGMVVDNSIVVLENIYRYRQMGRSRMEAAYEGAREVWGAVLASTLTTIAVFVPVLFIQDEVGQLFGDIALAIACAVGLSLIVSVTVIPSMSGKILGGSRGPVSGDGSDATGGRRGSRNLWGLVTMGQRVNEWVTNTVYWITGSVARRLAVVISLVVISIGLTLLLLPKAEYLPTGNRNFLFGFMLPPPGYNLDEVSAMEEEFEAALKPLWELPSDGSDPSDRPGGGMLNFFFVALNSQAFMGARAEEPLRVKELIPEFRKVNAKLPGTIFVINQASLFSRGRGQGRTIDIEVSGPDLGRLIGLGGEIFGGVLQNLPTAQAYPIPSLDLGNPEVRVNTHRRRAAELGLSNRELGYAVSALVDGAVATEYQHEGREIDLVLKAENGFGYRTHLLQQVPIATPTGKLVTLGSVADITVTAGPTTINHSERQRTITVRVTPDEQMPLETAMEVIQAQILQPMRDQGRLGGLYTTRLSGTADKLAETWSTLRWNFLLALLITFLLLAALFENFVYPFVIMFSVPLAAFGGVLGLAALNLFVGYQALDTLTMLGFIILIGTVVNNAILIVHQTLNHIREDGMGSRDAIRAAVQNRIRPIFMSVNTSVFGMLPLVLFPGAGSELYRGLGSVVVGGLIVSTVFTLFLVPSLLSLMLDVRAAAEAKMRRWFGVKGGPAEDAAGG